MPLLHPVPPRPIALTRLGRLSRLLPPSLRRHVAVVAVVATSMLSALVSTSAQSAAPQACGFGALTPSSASAFTAMASGVQA